MRNIEVKYGQSLFDIALQYYGSIEAVFWIVEDNNLNGIVDNVYEGDTLQIRDTVMNKQIVTELSKVAVATIYNESDRASGIGYMQVERDFDIK